MSDPKCPACRKRFSVDADSQACARCGADLSLLMMMRRHARAVVIDAFSQDSPDAAACRKRLREAQRICHSAEVQQWMDAMG